VAGEPSDPPSALGLALPGRVVPLLGGLATLTGAVAPVGEATGCPRRAGHLLTSEFTLQTLGSSKARVALIPEMAGSPLPTVCRSWHKHTNLLVTTVPSAEQQLADGGVVSFPVTYAKQDCREVNSFEQSTVDPAGPGDDAATGAEIGAEGLTTGGCATGAGGLATTGAGAVTGAGLGGGRVSPRSAGHLLVSAATLHSFGKLSASVAFTPY
jgi:hypothetical protein